MTTDALRLTVAPIAKKGMLIRRPPAEVFCAFADPAITSKFWFTQSSGHVTEGATLRWDWEMYGVSIPVAVTKVQPNERIVFDWGPEDRATTVEMRFVPWQDGTYVQITVSGFRGTGDEVVAQALDAISGFALVLAAAKALLEHDIVLRVVLDHAPKGLQL